MNSIMNSIYTGTNRNNRRYKRDPSAWEASFESAILILTRNGVPPGDELIIAIYPHCIKLFHGEVLFRQADIDGHNLTIYFYFESIAPYRFMVNDLMARWLDKLKGGMVDSFGGYYAWDVDTRKRVFL